MLCVVHENKDLLWQKSKGKLKSIDPLSTHAKIGKREKDPKVAIEVSEKVAGGICCSCKVPIHCWRVGCEVEDGHMRIAQSRSR